MSKNPPTARQWKLIEILKESAPKDKESKGGITLVDLADRLGVNTRTVRRDLEKLVKSEVPIQDRNEAHGRIVYWIDENRFKPPAFNVGEAAALYLGYRFLAPLADSFLGQDAEDGLAKIRKQLSSDSIRCLDRLKEIFHQSRTGWSDYTGQSEIILTLISACEYRNETEILYRSYSAKEEQLYRIHPYAIIIQQGTIYVLGFSCKRNEMRTWKLSRIIKADPLPTKFRKPEDFDLDAYHRRFFGIFTFDGRPAQKIRIKVDGPMARYVQEHRWHETQQFKQHADGSVIVQFEVVPLRDLKNWILSLGCNAEVLQPKSLRDEIAAEIVKMQQRYQ